MLEFFASQPTVPGIEIRAIVALAFTGAAAYFDLFHKKWVPNWLIYTFLLSAFALNIIFFEQTIFLHALFFAIIIFAISYPLYRLGQLGGADAYILCGIALSLPYFTKPFFGVEQSVPYPFILSALIPTGILFILHMLIRFVPFISKKLAEGKISFQPIKLIEPAILTIILVIFTNFLFLLSAAVPFSYLAIIYFLFISLLFFSLFKSEIKESMVEEVAVSKLQEEDVLALEKISPALIKKLSLQPLLDKKTISSLKKARIKKVPVYTGMPCFLPYLFLGVLISLLFGDLLIYLL